jgi:hypothetical protein
VRRIETRPAIACQERKRAARQVIADPAIDAALLGVADVLAEIARETGGALGREQTVSEVKHED